MSRLGKLAAAAEKYKGSGNNDFFTLENDKDTAVVRFLYKGEEDLDWFVVHEVEIEKKKRYVLCDESAECPACKAGNKPMLKLFLQLEDGRDGKVKTWERGPKFVPKILGIVNRYGNLFNRKFEIERQGKKGDNNTDYAIYPLDPDNIEFDKLPQRQELLAENGFILKKSYTEIEQILAGNYQYTPVENPTPRESSTPQGAPRRGTDVF